MTFKKSEKEFIKALVKYSDEAESLADAINKSHLLEKRGWNIVVGDDGKYFLFYRQDLYSYEDEQKVRGYLAELLAILEELYNERLLIAFPSTHNRPLVIGRENVTRCHLETRSVDNGKEFISFSRIHFGWYDRSGNPLYCWDECTEMVRPLEKLLFSAYHASEDLKELVKNNFKSEEDIRFVKQQWLTWISIAVAIIIGLLGIYK